MAGGVRVSLAFDDPTLEPSPTWTDLTEQDTRVSTITIDRGRQFELDITDTGRATVAINDRDGTLDPTNSSGPFYGLLDPLIQAQIELYNPVAAAWSTIFRGYLDEADYVFHDSQRVNQLTFSLVDILDLLGRIEMQPDGSFGDVVPAQSVGNIFFDNANVDDRILQVLGNAGIPAGLMTIFSGNVSLQESVYAPGDSVLDVCQNAADAEFPGLGNFFGSRIGKATFHGRFAKFDPVGVSAGAGGAWVFTEWRAGDGAAIEASVDPMAQLREFSFNRGNARLINYASVTPQGIADADRSGQVVTDPTSIGLRGFRPWSKENLLIDAGTTTGNDANDECLLIGHYYVDNYAEPRNRISNLAIKALRPDDSRAEATWALLCGAEVGDLLDVTIASPGGGGFNEDPHYFEGLHYEISPLDPEYAMVTLRPDLSPQAYFLTNPFS